MPDTDLRYLLLAGLAIALVTAAVTDLRRRQIDNWLNAAIALSAPLYWWASGLSLWPGVAIQIGMMLVVFFGFALVFARGGMGGGDVKLLSALALWLPPLALFSVIFLTSLIGGAMSMISGVRNLSLEADAKAKRGLAHAAAALWVTGSAYIAWIMQGGSPVDFGSIVPAALVTAIVLLALVITMTGAIIVSRNQKSRLPIPYGIAISSGCLFIILSNFSSGI